MQATTTMDEKMENDIREGRHISQEDIICEIKRRETNGFSGYALGLALIAGMPQEAIEVCEHIGDIARAYEIASNYNLAKEQKRLTRKMKENIRCLMISYSVPIN